jgi:DNA invertase Pin-like site-specific DNA recombinase
MKIGYAGVSTEEQNLSLQKQTLRAAAGCKVIIEDQGISGGQVARPGLADALSRLKKGDVLVVWRLDRLGRSLAHLTEIIAGLGASGAGFASLTEAIDTTAAGGRLVFHMMGRSRSSNAATEIASSGSICRADVPIRPQCVIAYST